MSVDLNEEGLPEINPSRRYSVKEAARLLGVTASTLYHWRANGQGPRCFQAKKHARTMYAGVWLQQFLRNSIQEPEHD